jgi:cysteine-rich repeat protein
VCPADTTCNATLELCVTSAQTAACAGLVDGETCDITDDVEACQLGVCVPVVCGNSRIDPGEVCDDGNATSGDDCSADCRSKETCGNGYADLIRGEACDDGNFIDHDGCASTCATETVVWHHVPYTPSARMSPGALYDAERDRVVLIGGLGNRIFNIGVFTEALPDAYEWDGRWHPAAYPPPPPRFGFEVAYDTRRKRMQYLGGRAASLATELWESDGTTWQVVSTDGPGLIDSGVAYDSLRGLLVVFGGLRSAGTQYTNETWTWDGTTWTQVTGAAPPVRYNPAMGFDPKRGKIVMYGGNREDGFYHGDLWELDAGGWTQRTLTSPPAGRSGAAMAWNSTCACMVIMGGVFTTGQGPAATNQVLAWTGLGTTLTNITPIDGPEARANAGFVTDGHGRSILIGGGRREFTSSETDAYIGDTWIFDGTSWYRDLQHLRPLAATDTTRHRVVLYGGAENSGTEFLVDTWELGPLGWQRVATTGPASAGGAMAYDEARRETVLYGGGDNQGDMQGGTWIWNGSAWSQRTVATQARPLINTLLVDDVERGQLVAFGGMDVNGLRYAETWTWDGVTWTARTPATSPSARSGMTGAYDRDAKHIVAFGGTVGFDAYDSTTWIWDGTTWTEVAAPGPQFTATGQAHMAWDASRRSLLLVTGAYLDAWEWLGTGTAADPYRWASLGNPGNLAMPSESVGFASYDGAGISVLGGRYASQADSDTWELRWTAATATVEDCRLARDTDGDGLAGCADDDCWEVCRPACVLGDSCDPAAARCGDGVCSTAETCRSCAADCTTCGSVCGDGVCDAAETCPGDC